MNCSRFLIVSMMFFSSSIYGETLLLDHSLFVSSVDGKRLAQIVMSTEENRAEAIFYKPLPNKELKLLSSFFLIDGKLPKNAYLSNSGNLITLDKLNQYGVGDYVIVLYDNNGKVIKNYGLSDLYSENEINKLLKTSSSIHWRCTEVGEKIHYINGNKLFVYDRTGGEIQINMNTGKINYKKQSTITCPKIP